jgi:CHAT domain-containing protein
MLYKVSSEQDLKKSIQDVVAQAEKEVKLKPVIFTAFANPAQDLQYLNKEQKEIQKLLMPLESQEQIAKHYNINDTSLQDYFDFIKAWENRLSIFHFGGHAGSLEIRLQDGKVFFEHLAKELINRNPSSLQLVFLNGCATQAHVQNLFELGAKAVIATVDDVKDGQASSFAIAFYQNLVNGDTLTQAFSSAVNFIQSPKGSSQRFRQGSRPIRWSKRLDHQGEFPWGLYINNDEVGEYRLVEA